MKTERTEESSQPTESTEEEQTSTPDKSTEPDSATESTLQQQIDQLKREYVEARANSINWWLRVIGILLAFIGVIGIIIGYLAFERFENLEATAKEHLQEILKHRRKAEEILREDTYGTLVDYLNDGSEDLLPMRSPQETNRIRNAIRDVKENPDSFLIDKAIADAYALNLKIRFTDAREKWKAIANIAEGNDNKLASLAWFMIGSTLRDENALDAYTKAINLMPTNSQAFNNRGVRNALLGNHDEAFKDYKEAIQQAPNDHFAYINRGNLHFHRGEYKSAIKDYNTVIDKLNLRWSDVYLSRAKAQAHLGQTSEAESDLRTGLAIAIQNGDNDLIIQIKLTIRELKLDSTK